MTKPTKTTTTKPQLLQPRTMRFADSEICATLLRIAPVGQYDPWADYGRNADGEILRTGVFERIMVFTETMPYWADKGALGGCPASPQEGQGEDFWR